MPAVRVRGVDERGGFTFLYLRQKAGRESAKDGMTWVSYMRSLFKVGGVSSRNPTYQNPPSSFFFGGVAIYTVYI